MGIDHVSLTLFAWNETAGAGADVRGHALFGSATLPAADDEPGPIRSFGPLLMGRDPPGRERLDAEL